MSPPASLDSSSQPPIPQDLIDTIIDIVPTSHNRLDSRNTLRTCLVVSKSFLHRSRSLLFEQVELRSGEFVRSKEFRELLDRGSRCNLGFPSLRTCIRSLKIIWADRFSASGPPDNSDYEAEKEAEKEDWITILSMLAESPTLRAFDLSFYWIVRYTDLSTSKGVHQSLMNLCCSPSLEHLSLENLYGVKFDELGILRVNTLSLDNITMLGLVQDSQESLVQARSSSNSSTAPKIPALRNLIFRFGSTDSRPEVGGFHQSFDAVDHLLLICSQTLQTLDIRIQADSRTISTNHPNLNLASSLRQLKFTLHPHMRTDFHDFDALEIVHVPDVVAILNSINKVPPALNFINIVFHVWVKQHYRWDEFGFENASDWRALGDALTDRRYKAVEKVEVTMIVLNRYGNDWIDWAHEPFLEDFPPLWRAAYPTVNLRIDRQPIDKTQIEF